MNNFKDKIKQIATNAPSKWKENAEYRKNNKWLRYSSQIARRILAAIQEDKDLTQSKLAQSVNVSPQQISKIVKGHENLTLETIYKLSQALGIELISFPEYKYSSIGRERSTTSSICVVLNEVSTYAASSIDSYIIATNDDNKLVSSSIVEANPEGIAA